MKQLRNLIFLNCIIFIYGCESLPSFDEVLPDKRTTYRKSKDLPELEVPPDLTVTKVHPLNYPRVNMFRTQKTQYDNLTIR